MILQVNSAGIVHNYPAMEYPANKYKQLMDVNVNGSFYTAREAARYMMKGGHAGSIVLIGSMSGQVMILVRRMFDKRLSNSCCRLSTFPSLRLLTSAHSLLSHTDQTDRVHTISASKAAVHHMASSLAVEWAPHKIRVNAIVCLHHSVEAITDPHPS